MMHVRNGELLENGELVADGYSGGDDGKNNPDMQAVHNVGPIPRGGGSIEGPPIDIAKHGPYALRLKPASGTDTFRRSGFLIHPRSKKSPGCVIMPLPVRELLWNSGHTELEVVAEFQTQDVKQDKTA
jgi:hypothetical protein